MADRSTPKDESTKKTNDEKKSEVKPTPASGDKAKGASTKTSAGTEAPKSDAATKTTSSPASSSSKSSSVPGSGKTTTSSSATAAGATSASATPAKKKSGVGLAFKLVLVIVLLGGGAFVTKDIWLPSVEPLLAGVPGLAPSSQPSSEPMAPAAPVAEVVALTERLAALEKRVQTSASSAGASSGAQDEVMAALQAEKDRMQGELSQALERIGDLETRLQEVRQMAQAVTRTPSGAEVDLSPMMSRIDSIEESTRRTSQELSALTDKVESGLSAPVASGDGRANALVLSVAQLRDTVLSGQPYAGQLDAFQTFAQGNADLTAAAARLSDGASAGLPTVDDLATGFAEIAGNIVAISRTSDGDWLAQTAGRLSTLISVRRTDGQSGDPVEDAVATIENHLSNGDVRSAVETARALSDGLSTEPKALMEDWLLDATRRADVEATLDALSASALAGFGG